MTTNQQAETLERLPISTNDKSPRQRNASARVLLRAWLTDESGYDEETWPRLKQSLEANRLDQRKLYCDG